MFFPHTNDKGAVQPWEYLSAKAGTYQAGQLLNAEGGYLTPVSEASPTTPGYLCMASVTIAEGDVIPVTRVARDTAYETRLSAQADAAAVGSKLQVSAGGLQVDAAAAGTFEIQYIEDTAAGSLVRGRFQ